MLGSDAYHSPLAAITVGLGLGLAELQITLLIEGIRIIWLLSVKVSTHHSPLAAIAIGLCFGLAELHITFLITVRAVQLEH